MHSCSNGSSQNVVLEEVRVSGNCSLRLWNMDHPRVLLSQYTSVKLYDLENLQNTKLLVLFSFSRGLPVPKHY